MKTFPILTSALAAVFLSGCATNRVTPRVAPSLVPVRTSVTKAKASSALVAESADKAIAGVKKAQAQVASMDKARLKLTLATVGQELSDLKDQNTATVDALSNTLLQVDTLQKEVDAQTKDLNTSLQADKDDQAKLAVEVGKNKKLARDVWIYKGGFIVFLLAMLAIALLHAGILTRLLTMGLALEFPWSWLALGIGVPLLVTGCFYTLWRFLP